MNKDFASRFLMAIVLVTVFTVPFVWAFIGRGYFAQLSKSSLFLHGLAIAAVDVALAVAIAAFMTWLAEQNASTQDDRSKPRS